MARTLTAAQATEVAKTVGARPGYLVELGFASTLRLTSFESTVTWNSQSWVASGVRVSGITHGAGSAQQARITLPDTDGAYFAVVRADGLDDRTAKIWSVHGGPASYALTDPVQLFDGYMDGAPEMAERITISLTTQGNRTMFTPRNRIAPQLFNYLPAHGEKRRWGNVIMIAQRSPE